MLTCCFNIWEAESGDRPCDPALAGPLSALQEVAFHRLASRLMSILRLVPAVPLGTGRGATTLHALQSLFSQKYSHSGAGQTRSFDSNLLISAKTIQVGAGHLAVGLLLPPRLRSVFEDRARHVLVGPINASH